MVPACSRGGGAERERSAPTMTSLSGEQGRQRAEDVLGSSPGFRRCWSATGTPANRSGPDQASGGNCMSRLIRFNRLLVVGIVAAAAVLSVTQVAQAGPPPPVVPSKIEVHDGNKVAIQRG